MKKIKTNLIIMWIAAVIIMLLSANVNAYVIKQQWVRFSATAGETLTTGHVVAIKDADGYAYKADADAATLRPAVGVIGKGGTSGQTVEIIVVGIVSGWTGLSEGQNGYLSETAGAITQSAPTWNQQVGTAISTTEYLINCKNYLDTSALTTLGVLSGASPLVFEGATADDFETTIAVTDPTADRTITIPDASGTPVLSTLATNAPDAANSVTGASNGLVFEGATADAHETTITPTDPTADRTITLPDASGTICITGTNGSASHDYGAAHADWSISALEAEATYLAATNADQAVNALLASCRAGKQYYVYNNSGQVLTFKVTGQAGGTIATGKLSLYVCNGTDVVELYEQP